MHQLTKATDALERVRQAENFDFGIVSKKELNELIDRLKKVNK
jgi:hypothetical protein